MKEPMKRYTSNQLEVDVRELNAKLEKHGHEMRFSVGGSYGRTDLDLATVPQLASHCCQRRLISGSPRECLSAAHAYVVSHI